MNASVARYRGVYALVDPASHENPIGYVDALLRGGIRIFQIRAKGGIELPLLRLFVARIRAEGGIAIVNDDVELALEADGVHLGQEDLVLHDLAALRSRLGARCIGLSCGTPAEARAVPAGTIDYVGAGPIFATATKGDAGGPIGINGVRVVVEATPLPVAAIGGVTLGSMPRVRETGAAMAAVISALSAAPDPEAAARAFVQAWDA
jgi:thiamine-phosphate diphosphorylase